MSTTQDAESTRSPIRRAKIKWQVNPKTHDDAVEKAKRQVSARVEEAKQRLVMLRRQKENQARPIQSSSASSMSSPVKAMKGVLSPNTRDNVGDTPTPVRRREVPHTHTTPALKPPSPLQSTRAPVTESPARPSPSRRVPELSLSSQSPRLGSVTRILRAAGKESEIDKRSAMVQRAQVVAQRAVADENAMVGSPAFKDQENIQTQPKIQQAPATEFSRGDRCRVHSLRSKDTHLNGTEATVVGPTKCGRGFRVRLSPDALTGRPTKLANIRSKNLQLLEAAEDENEGAEGSVMGGGDEVNEAEEGEEVDPALAQQLSRAEDELRRGNVGDVSVEVVDMEEVQQMAGAVAGIAITAAGVDATDAQSVATQVAQALEAAVERGDTRVNVSVPLGRDALGRDATANVAVNMQQLKETVRSPARGQRTTVSSPVRITAQAAEVKSPARARSSLAPASAAAPLAQPAAQPAAESDSPTRLQWRSLSDGLQRSRQQQQQQLQDPDLMDMFTDLDGSEYASPGGSERSFSEDQHAHAHAHVHARSPSPARSPLRSPNSLAPAGVRGSSSVGAIRSAQSAESEVVAERPVPRARRANASATPAAHTPVPAAAASPPMAPGSAVFVPGQRVRVGGLSLSDTQLNGAVGVVVTATKCGGGYKVRLGDDRDEDGSGGGRIVNVRKKNLVLLKAMQQQEWYKEVIPKIPSRSPSPTSLSPKRLSRRRVPEETQSPTKHEHTHGKQLSPVETVTSSSEQETEQEAPPPPPPPPPSSLMAPPSPEFKPRIEKHRASTGLLSFSIMWDGGEDLDLHCQTPSGEVINFHNKSADGGNMDVDKNGSIRDRVPDPVVNISWHETPPSGRYRLWVANYSQVVSHLKLRPATRREVDFKFQVMRQDEGTATVREFVWRADAADEESCVVFDDVIEWGRAGAGGEAAGGGAGGEEEEEQAQVANLAHTRRPDDAADSPSNLPTSDEAAASLVRRLGLRMGGPPFAGPYPCKGLHAYKKGPLAGCAFFGTGGTRAQMQTPLTPAGEDDDASAEGGEFEVGEGEGSMPHLYPYRPKPVAKAALKPRKKSHTTTSWLLDSLAVLSPRCGYHRSPAQGGADADADADASEGGGKGGGAELPTDEYSAESMARRLGLYPGGRGFVVPAEEDGEDAHTDAPGMRMGTKGLYFYTKGPLAGCAFFGAGGTREQMQAPVQMLAKARGQARVDADPALQLQIQEWIQKQKQEQQKQGAAEEFVDGAASASSAAPPAEGGVGVVDEGEAPLRRTVKKNLSFAMDSNAAQDSPVPTTRSTGTACRTAAAAEVTGPVTSPGRGSVGWGNASTASSLLDSLAQMRRTDCPFSAIAASPTASSGDGGVEEDEDEDEDDSGAPAWRVGDQVLYTDPADGRQVMATVVSVDPTAADPGARYTISTSPSRAPDASLEETMRASTGRSPLTSPFGSFGSPLTSPLGGSIGNLGSRAQVSTRALSPVTPPMAMSPMAMLASPPPLNSSPLTRQALASPLRAMTSPTSGSLRFQLPPPPPSNETLLRTFFASQGKHGKDVPHILHVAYRGRLQDLSGALRSKYPRASVPQFYDEQALAAKRSAWLAGWRAAESAHHAASEAKSWAREAYENRQQQQKTARKQSKQRQQWEEQEKREQELQRMLEAGQAKEVVRGTRKLLGASARVSARAAAAETKTATATATARTATAAEGSRPEWRSVAEGLKAQYRRKIEQEKQQASARRATKVRKLPPAEHTAEAGRVQRQVQEIEEKRKRSTKGAGAGAGVGARHGSRVGIGAGAGAAAGAAEDEAKFATTATRKVLPRKVPTREQQQGADGDAAGDGGRGGGGAMGSMRRGSTRPLSPEVAEVQQAMSRQQQPGRQQSQQSPAPQQLPRRTGAVASPTGASVQSSSMKSPLVSSASGMAAAGKDTPTSPTVTAMLNAVKKRHSAARKKKKMQQQQLEAQASPQASAALWKATATGLSERAVANRTRQSAPR